MKCMRLTAGQLKCAFAMVCDIGTAMALAFDTAANRTLSAEYLLVSTPDLLSIILIHLAIVSFVTFLWLDKANE